MDWIEVNEVVLRVKVEGQGPPLVLVHEIGGMIESYDDIVPLLRSRFTVVRYDLRGSGLSEFARESITLHNLVEDLRQLLDRIDLKQVFLAGTALGAALAIVFALEHPNRVSKIVAMSPALSIPPERRAATLSRAELFEQEGMRPTHASRLASSYPDVLRVDQDRFRRIFLRRLTANPYGVAGLIRVLANLDLVDRLPTLKQPVLVLAGRHDGDRPPAVVRPAADAIPNARYAEIASGHFMASQTPSLVANAIVGFLSPEMNSAEVD